MSKSIAIAVLLATLSISTTGVAGVSSIASPQWTFTDDFEGAKDTTFWAGDGVYVNYGVEDITDASNKVMEMTYVPNSEGGGDSWSEYDFRLGIDAVQVELGWKMYVPPNYTHIENNHKVYALWSGTYGKVNANISVSSEAWGQTGGASPSVYVGEDGVNFGHAMLSNASEVFMWEDANGVGRWIDVTILLELAQQEGDYGKLELWVDGEFITGTHHPNLTKAYTTAPVPPNIISYSSRGNFIDQGTLLGWANGTIGFTETTVFQIDDFYVKANSNFGLINWGIEDEIDGVCGSNHGGTFSTLDAVSYDDYCAAGNVSGLSGTGPWTWSCVGTGGGSTASCSAQLAAPPGDTCADSASLCESEEDCGTYWPAYNWCTDSCQAIRCPGGGTGKVSFSLTKRVPYSSTKFAPYYSGD